ncbi:ATP-binding SpoIIE family protein phosphatase [Streptomyces sp. NPDC001595]|uniref:ATP-binding SpoIIE family protein phosphatase n=1 Tax=Streptomyces sp. NPDC001532 TaxID=3154520 RepID=UPI00331FA2ED
MGAIPTQRESPRDWGADFVAAYPPAQMSAQVCVSLDGSPLAPGAGRRLLRTALREWAELGLPGADRVGEDAAVIVSELVTNAVVHAGTDVELAYRLETETGALVVEVTDRHPARAPRDGDTGPAPAHETPEYGRGLRLVATLAESWGVTYRRGAKTVWARLGGPEREAGEEEAADPAYGDTLGVAGLLAPRPRRAERDREWLGRGALSFLAEASDLLAGQLDEDLVAALTGQLLVPRLADWCAIWLEDEAMGRGRWTDGGTGAPGPRLARVWHASEDRMEELRHALEKEPPHTGEDLDGGPAPYPRHEERYEERHEERHEERAADGGERSGIREEPGPGRPAPGPSAIPAPGAALAFRLVAGGRPLGSLVIGRDGDTGFPDEVTGLVEDLSRRVALAIGAARQYARQVTISSVLQRGLLPDAVAEIPGLRSALVHEPCDVGGPSGDFYDLFPAGAGRWCFAIGDVQGKGPEAAVVIGLARPWLRLLAREGYQVADVLDRLNQLLLDDATEAADAAARALAGPVGPGDGPQTRFLSLLYGELVPFDGGVRCTLASAGHPLPLVLGPDGAVRTAAGPQTLLGVVEDETYVSETFELLPGDTLLCVTDGVTERRCGPRQFDDGDGLAAALAGCAGLSAELIAERIRELVHGFGGLPPEDDLALLVLQAE